MKTIEYPLAATFISKKDMQDIMCPILQAALPKARTQKQFPRKRVCGTLMSEAFGVYDPSASQVIEHVHSPIRHSFQDSPSNVLANQIPPFSPSPTLNFIHERDLRRTDTAISTSS